MEEGFREAPPSLIQKMSVKSLTDFIYTVEKTKCKYIWCGHGCILEAA